MYYYILLRNACTHPSILQLFILVRVTVGPGAPLGCMGSVLGYTLDGILVHNMIYNT